MTKHLPLARLLAPKTLIAAVAFAGIAAVAAGPAEAAYVKAGVLTCNVAPAVGLLVTERVDMTCTFAPTNAQAETYVGTLRKFGLAIGATAGGVIVWAVLSAVNNAPSRGALAGEYTGASAEASVIVGAGANVLLGGSNKTFALQPVSVQGQIGLDFAVGVSALVLNSAQ